MAKLILIGRVIDIDGPRLMFHHADKHSTDTWYQAHVGMNFYLNDEFRTDSKTQATLAFSCGGRVRVPTMHYKPKVKKSKPKPSIYPNRNSALYPNRNSSAYPGGGISGAYLKIVGERKAEIFDPYGARIRPAKFWSKFDKQEDELRIYTIGGVLGGGDGTW